MEAVQNMFMNIIEYGERLVVSLCLLILSFTISLYIEYRKIEEDFFVDQLYFKQKYILAHGLACIFSLFYACISYFVSGTSFEIIMIIIFYVFLIKIIMVQNSEDFGYIELMDGASGPIMFISATIHATAFVIMYTIMIIFSYWKYKLEDNNTEIKSKKNIYAINLTENIVLVILVKYIQPDSFIGTLWLNVIIISFLQF